MGVKKFLTKPVTGELAVIARKVLDELKGPIQDLLSKD
jgi:hypothetical protein